MNQVDVLVIGAGPSGTIAAAILKKKGYHVEVVEKLTFPRFVIGESLLPRCMEAFEEADLLDCLKARGYQQKSGAKFVRGHDITKEEIFDISFSECHTVNSKTWTWQVPREDFDKTLADECVKKGIPIHYQAEVVSIEIADDETSLTTVVMANGEKKQFKARFIVDGSGYGRVIPRLFNMDQPSGLPSRETLFTHFLDKNRETVKQVEPNRITIYVYNENTWVWCIPFSNGYCSVGFVGFPEFFANLNQNKQLTEKNPEAKLRFLVNSHPRLKERFSDCEMRFEPRTLQSWSASTRQFYGKGFVLTGNVTEFLDPVFSSGVTLASVSAQNAANLVVRKLAGESVDWQKEYQEVCERGVNVFRTFVESWYNEKLHTIFFADKKIEEMRRQIASVLAGYVWDETNPFVSQHNKYVTKLASFLETR